MADKKLNDLTTASDGAYVYAEDASGNQIKISKADLASVVAGLLPVADEFKKGLMPGMYTYKEYTLQAGGSWNLGAFIGFIIWRDVYSYGHWHLYYSSGNSLIDLSNLQKAFGEISFVDGSIVYNTTAPVSSNFNYYILRMP